MLNEARGMLNDEYILEAESLYAFFRVTNILITQENAKIFLRNIFEYVFSASQFCFSFTTQ